MMTRGRRSSADGKPAQSHDAFSPCPCRGLHSSCDPTGCDQQRHAPNGEYDTTFTGLRAGAARGCKTCCTLVDGLSLPPIKMVWMESVDEAVSLGTIHAGVKTLTNIEDAFGLRIMVRQQERAMVRTFLSGAVHTWRHFNFNLERSVAASACMPFPTLQSSLVDRTNSEAAYNHLQRWIRECDRHDGCAPKSPPPLPKRVLEISDNSLRLNLNAQEESSHYMTLSHRWGLTEGFTLKRTNIEILTQGIPWPQLPKTARDAVQVCRKLHIRYLWVDLLCIVQDDERDWREQAQLMSYYYGNSYLNIAAVDSDHSGGGCFRQSDAITRFPFHKIPGSPQVLIMQQPIHTHKDFGAYYPRNRSSPPLFQRGWVLQERLLSPRIVYYAKDEILWECREMSECLCGGIKVLAPFKTYFNRALEGGDPLPFAWMHVAQRYSCLKLTYETDRLIALAGIAKQARLSGRGGDYLAGMWSTDLAYQLCWTVMDTWRKQERYLAPSWSWISVLGRVEFAPRVYKQLGPSEIEVDLISASCKGRGLSTLYDIESGHIEVTGKMLDVDSDLVGAQPGHRAMYRFWRKQSSFQYHGFRPDYIMEVEDAKSLKMVSLLFWGTMWGERYTFMVLIPSHPKVEGEYQRLGIFWIPVASGAQKLRSFLDACILRSNIRII